MRTSQVILGALVAAAVLGPSISNARAQDGERVQQIERLLRNIEQNYVLPANRALTLGERAYIDYGALLNFTFMAVDDASQSTRLLRQYDVQGYGHLNIDGVHEFYGRLRWTYRDYNSGDSFDGRGDRDTYPLYDRAWYRFDLARAIATSEGRSVEGNLIFQGGRQFVDWASGLTLSEQLYAARVWVEMPGPALEAELLFGATPSSSVVDFDSSRTSYDVDTDRFFFGGMLTYTGLTNHKPYIYVLDQTDNNGEDFDVISLGGLPPANYDTRFEYNSTYWGIGSTGNLLVPELSYVVEFVYETGDNLSTPFDGGFVQQTQTRDSIEAWAAKAQFTYQFDPLSRTQVEFEALLASGDDDRFFDTSNTFGGNTRNTKDNAFNAFGYANTGLAFNAPLSNLAAFRLGGSTYPMPNHEWFKRCQVGVDLFMFNKLDPDAPLDETTNDRSYLGFESDLFVNWRLTSDFSIDVRYGVFFPGSAIAGDSDERHFFLTGVTWSF